MLKNAKKFDEKFLKYWGLSGAKACKSCRSRQELSNEYFIAKFGVDTAENEPLKVHLIFQPWISISFRAAPPQGAPRDDARRAYRWREDDELPAAAEVDDRALQGRWPDVPEGRLGPHFKFPISTEVWKLQ